ncbi:hypothetical protein MT418_008265 [Batrachochytrium dendrobatidis]
MANTFQEYLRLGPWEISRRRHDRANFSVGFVEEWWQRNPPAAYDSPKLGRLTPFQCREPTITGMSREEFRERVHRNNHLRSSNTTLNDSLNRSSVVGQDRPRVSFGSTDIVMYFKDEKADSDCARKANDCIDDDHQFKSHHTGIYQSQDKSLDRSNQSYMTFCCLEKTNSSHDISTTNRNESILNQRHSQSADSLNICTTSTDDMKMNDAYNSDSMRTIRANSTSTLISASEFPPFTKSHLAASKKTSFTSNPAAKPPPLSNSNNQSPSETTADARIQEIVPTQFIFDSSNFIAFSHPEPFDFSMKKAHRRTSFILDDIINSKTSNVTLTDAENLPKTMSDAESKKSDIDPLLSTVLDAPNHSISPTVSITSDTTELNDIMIDPKPDAEAKPIHSNILDSNQVDPTCATIYLNPIEVQGISIPVPYRDIPKDLPCHTYEQDRLQIEAVAEYLTESCRHIPLDAFPISLARRSTSIHDMDRSSIVAPPFNSPVLSRCSIFNNIHQLDYPLPLPASIKDKGRDISVLTLLAMREKKIDTVNELLVKLIQAAINVAQHVSDNEYVRIAKLLIPTTFHPQMVDVHINYNSDYILYEEADGKFILTKPDDSYFYNQDRLCKMHRTQFKSDTTKPSTLAAPALSSKPRTRKTGSNHNPSRLYSDQSNGTLTQTCAVSSPHQLANIPSKSLHVHSNRSQDASLSCITPTDELTLNNSHSVASSSGAHPTEYDTSKYHNEPSLTKSIDNSSATYIRVDSSENVCYDDLVDWQYVLPKSSRYQRRTWVQYILGFK